MCCVLGSDSIWCIPRAACLQIASSALSLQDFENTLMELYPDMTCRISRCLLSLFTEDTEGT